MCLPEMTQTFVTCAQCGWTVQSDAPELARWSHGALAVAGDLDETSAAIVVCPECAEESRLGAFDPGGD
jgi:hypothetical protein